MSFTPHRHFPFTNLISSQAIVSNLLQPIRNYARFERLKDIDDLRVEINRITSELKNFDFSKRLSPKAKRNFKVLKARYQNLLLAIRALQRQLDAKLDQFIAMARSKPTPDAVKTTPPPAPSPKPSLRKVAKSKAPKPTRKTTSKKTTTARKSR